MIRPATKYESKSNIKRITKLLFEICFEKERPMFSAGYKKATYLNYFKEMFVLENNYFSYENCIIKEIKGKTIAVILLEKDDVVLTHLKESWKIAKKIFKYDELIEKESLPNEITIEVIAVIKKYQGQGIGTELINYAYEFYKKSKYKNLALNVSYDNLRAKALYLRNGFIVHSTMSLLKRPFFHMIKSFKT